MGKDKFKHGGFDPRADGVKPEYNDVIFTILQARNLAAADNSGFFRLGKPETSDPYCWVRDVKGLRGSDQRTTVVEKTLNPVWNQEFRYTFNFKLSRFKFVVYDHDTFKEADPLGKVVIGLPMFYDLPNRDGWRVLEGWFPLTVGSTSKWSWLRGRRPGSLGELQVRIAVRFNIPLCLPGRPLALSSPFVQIALGWDFGKNKKPIDLDASVIGFDARWNMIDSVHFKRLTGFNGAVRHSGDDRTGDGGGDDETISVDLMRLVPQLTFLCVVVNSFTGQSLAAVKHGYIRIVEHGRTAGIVTMYRNPVDRDTMRYASANPYEMKDCTGLLFGVLARKSTGQFDFICINEVANGRTVQDSTPAVIHACQAFLSRPAAAPAAPIAPVAVTIPAPAPAALGVNPYAPSGPPAAPSAPVGAPVYPPRSNQEAAAAGAALLSAALGVPAPMTIVGAPGAPGAASATAGASANNSTNAQSRSANNQGPVSSWDVDAVCVYLDSLELGSVKEQFRESGVDGQMLKDLSAEDLVNELGLKPLQARKVMQRLPA